MLRI
ncbi:hypothetical protein Gasu_64010, partial [Galdieria sulphuraria]|jgi:hypothetical protein